MTLSGLVTGIAFVHYMYMREVWVTWQSLAAAQRAEESEADTPAARAANALIDDKSATLRRAELLLPAVP